MESFLKEFQHLKIELGDIKSATDNFGSDKVIGRGGFGNVYKGSICHSQGKSTVAIKRLDRRLGQGNVQFWREIMMLSRYTHENLISLVGFCDEGGEKILVYEHASHKSLDRHLSSTFLTWTRRIKICLDAARGLSYLHDDKGTQQRVLHRDIKSSNILLDENWSAKVSDMGLSKIGPANQMHSALITDVVGTFGYLDPLYMETGILSKESDVYSFGVVLLEVLCGRLCYENNGQILVGDWKQSYKQNKVADIIFQDLTQKMESASLKIFSDIAFQCLQKSREERPTMPDVVKHLESALESQELSESVDWLLYKEIISTMVPPLNCRSKAELHILLSQGVLFNCGKMWFLLNDNGKHSVMIHIAECLTSKAEDLRYSIYSRFPSGTYSTKSEKEFKTRVSTQLLSPLTPYRVNLVFKYPEFQKQQYISLIYIFDGTKNISIVHLDGKSEFEWLKAELYQFTTTSYQRSVDLEFFFFEYKTVNKNQRLEVEGIEFEPLEKDFLVEQCFEEWEEILKAAEPPLIYRPIEELAVILDKGFHLNKTWFSLHENGKHSVMISIAECLTSKAEDSRYSIKYNSRFPSGTYSTKSEEEFKTRVRTQLLSPLTSYRVNFVCKYPGRLYFERHQYISLIYILDGTKNILIVHIDGREDEWVKGELYQFTTTSYQRSVDLEFIFKYHTAYKNQRLEVEGIEFEPIEKMEQYEEMEEYEEILKAAEPPLIYRSIEELEVILSKGVHLNGGKTWFSIDDNGKHIEMISICECWAEKVHPVFDSGANSRFIFGGYRIFGAKFKTHVCTQFLSPLTKYKVCLVFKIEGLDSVSEQEAVKVKYRLLGKRKYLTSKPASKRDDTWLMIELYEVTSEGSNFELKIEFGGWFSSHTIMLVEGIEFRPLLR